MQDKKWALNPRTSDKCIEKCKIGQDPVKDHYFTKGTFGKPNGGTPVCLQTNNNYWQE